MPPPKELIECGGLIFSTQKELGEHVRKLRDDIGVKGSIKTSHPAEYEFFLNLFRRHPDYPEKLFGMTDLAIKWNHTSQLALELIKEDGTLDDISIPVCISGKAKNNFKIAMRSAIDDQIRAFREETVYRCAECSTTDKSIQYDVDHIRHFEQLLQDFLSGTTLAKPTEFEDREDNRKVFLTADKEFEEAWQTFHKIHARLRILCHSCNGKRAKWRPGGM